MELINLFRAKSWEINEEFHLSRFSRFYNLLIKLPEHLQDAIIEWTHRFNYIPENRYVKELVPVLEQLKYNYPGCNLHFAPCAPKQDWTAAKSSFMLLYLLKGGNLKMQMQVPGSWRFIDDPQKIKLNPRGRNIIVLVDDFIGTGDTALQSIQDYSLIYHDTEIILLSIVCLNEGLQRLKADNYSIYSAKVEYRGISDYYTGNDLVASVMDMNQIEKTIKVKHEWSFGYKHSEALVSMERCPNNTFPLYWYGKNTAPFER